MTEGRETSEAHSRGSEQSDGGDENQGPSRGARNTILVIGIVFIAILLCMCLSVFALVAV